MRADKAAADARMAEANKLVDDSIIKSIKQSQQTKALQEEVRVWHGWLAGGHLCTHTHIWGFGFCPRASAAHGLLA